MAEHANITELPSSAIPTIRTINTDVSIFTLYQQWLKWQRVLSVCSESMEQTCFNMLNAYEYAICSKEPETAQEFAILMLVYTNDGMFSLSDEIIAKAQHLAQAH